MARGWFNVQVLETMENRDVVRISGVVLTFAICIGIGFFMSSAFGIKETERVENPVETALQAFGQSSENTERPSDVSAGESSEQFPVDVTPLESEIDSSAVSADLISDVNGPNLYPTTSPERIGYYLSVKLSDDCEDAVVTLSRDGDVVYTAKNNIFNDVMPVQDGKYLLEVSSGNRSDEMEISGFNLLPRWSGEFLRGQFNSSAKDKQFFRHFAPNVVLKCEGISEGNSAPQTISSLISTLPAMGWTVTDVRGVTYDQYNRIKTLTVIISEL